MRELIQAMMKEVLDRKVMGIRKLLAAAMAVLAHQLHAALRAVVWCFNLRRRRRSHWSQRFHRFGHPICGCLLSPSLCGAGTLASAFLFATLVSLIAP